MVQNWTVVFGDNITIQGKEFYLCKNDADSDPLDLCIHQIKINNFKSEIK